jgi:hypothetical protein
MSQDYINALRIAKSLGIKPTPYNVEPKENPEMESIRKDKLDRMINELEMCHMIIKHFDNNLRKMEKDLNQASKHMQEIARYRLSWMVGELPVDIFDNEEVV